MGNLDESKGWLQFAGVVGAISFVVGNRGLQGR